MAMYIQWFINVKTGATQTYKKINARLTGYMTIEIPHMKTKYGLCGIVFHNGETTNEGHFTCVGRASSCVARKCTGMVNSTKNCEHYGWRFWNDRSVSQPLCFNDAIKAATKDPSLSYGDDG
jgi:hypothetical protein